MKRSWAVLALCAALPHAAAAGAEKPLGLGCRNEEAFLMATVVAEVKHRKFDSHYALGSSFESRRESAVRHENNRNVFRAKVSGLHNWIDRRQLHETEEPPTDKERVALYTRHFEAWACTAPVGPEHFATDPEAVEGHAPLDLYHWTIAYRGDPTMAARDQSLFFGGRSKAPEAKLTCEELFGTDVRLGIGEPYQSPAARDRSVRAAEILCEPFHRVMRCVPGLEKRVGEAWQAARAGGATIHPGWAGIVAGPDGRFQPKLGSFARPPAPGHALRGCAEAP